MLCLTHAVPLTGLQPSAEGDRPSSLDTVNRWAVRYWVAPAAACSMLWVFQSWTPGVHIHMPVWDSSDLMCADLMGACWCAGARTQRMFMTAGLVRSA